MYATRGKGKLKASGNYPDNVDHVNGTRVGDLAPVSEEYGTLRVRVGEEIVEFVGRELIHVPGERNERTNEPCGQDFTLYETPDEGRQLHVQEWRIKGNTERKTLESAAEIERIGALYSEVEAKRTYPKVLQELLRLARD